MQAVVHDAQDLFEILVSRLGALQLIEIDHLVKDHDQTCISGEPDEGGEQLQAVVNISVVDDVAHTQRLPRLGLRRILAS